MAIIYNILVKKIHLQCTLLRFRHSHGKYSTPCRLVLSCFIFHTRDNSTWSCTEMSCTFLFKSLLIRMVCNHHILLMHFMNILNYNVVSDISAPRFENTQPAHSANFENGMETGLNIYGIIMIRLCVFSLLYSTTSKKVRSPLHFTPHKTFSTSMSLGKENCSDYL